MTEQACACAEWFRNDPAFHRLLKELRKKYKKHGRPAGRVALPDAGPEELEAARRFFGRDFSPPLQFRTAEFEAALQESKFAGACLKDVLEAYFGDEIRTRRELRDEQGQRFSALIRAAGEATESPLCRRWLAALADRQAGCDALKRAAGQDAGSARRALIRACRALETLERPPARRLRLAVLSAQAAGDPHALDSGTLCGRLFLHGLAFCAGQDFPASAEQRDALYFRSGILCDSISSAVTQLGLALGTAEGEHPGCRVFRERREPCTLTLSTLSRLTGARSPSGRVYLVENEGVFCQLCDQAERFHSPLVCTSGQPSVAALQLLDLLAASGAELFYSGDFDGKGLSIAALLLSRLPQSVRLWRLSPADYAYCRSDEALGERSLALLEGCCGTPLEGTADAVRQSGLAGYQELLLPLLEADLTETPQA